MNPIGQYRDLMPRLIAPTLRPAAPSAPEPVATDEVKLQALAPEEPVEKVAPTELDGRREAALAPGAAGGLPAIIALNELAKDRPRRDPEEAVTFVSEFNEELGLGQEAVEERLGLMKRSPYMFFRANPALFHKDVSTGAHSHLRLFKDDPPKIAINGDPHLGNYGTFKGPEGDTVWGINDYDQAGRGNPERDLARLGSSLILLAAELGLKRKDGLKLVKRLGEEYFDAVKDIAKGREGGPAYLTEKEASGPVKELIEKSDEKTQERLLARFTVNGERFREDHDQLIPLNEQQRTALQQGLVAYDETQGETPRLARPLEVLDMVAKIGSGGSSRGLQRYYVLAAHADPDEEPLIVEFKQLLPSPIDRQDGDLSRADGPAGVALQEEMGGLANPLTGAVRMLNSAFLVREREAEKGSFDERDVDSRKCLTDAVEQAALVLARSHTREPGNAAALKDWIGNEKKGALRLVRFSADYARQAVADQRALREA